MSNFKLASSLSAIISPGFIRRRLVGFSLHRLISEVKANKRRARSKPAGNLLRSKNLFHFLFPRSLPSFPIHVSDASGESIWSMKEDYVLREPLAAERGITATFKDIQSIHWQK